MGGIIHHSEATPALSSPVQLGCLGPRDRSSSPGLPAEQQWGPGTAQSPPSLNGPGEKMTGAQLPAAGWILVLLSLLPLSHGCSPPSLGCYSSMGSLDSAPLAASLPSSCAFGQNPIPSLHPSPSGQKDWLSGLHSPFHALVSHPVQWAFGPGPWLLACQAPFLLSLHSNSF